MSNIQLYSVPLPGFAAKARSAIDQELVLLPRLRANDTVTATAATTSTITATIVSAKSTFDEVRSPGFAILELISTVLTIVVSGINLFP